MTHLEEETMEASSIDQSRRRDANRHDTKRHDEERRDDIIIIIKAESRTIDAEGRSIKRPGETTRHEETQTDATKRRDDIILIIKAESRTIDAEGRSIKRSGETTAWRAVRTIDAEEGRSIEERLGETRGEPFERSMCSCERGMIDNRVFNNTNKPLEERRSNSYPSGTIVKAINQDQQQVWRSSTGMQTV